MIEWSEFSPKALDFLENSNARLNILHGSVRSSKTINCTVRWIMYCLEAPAGDLAMLGKTLATLKRNVLNDLFDIVGPEECRWVDRQQGELFLLGRRVYCFGANNEDAESKIRGATLAGAYCDEVTLYPQSVFNQLMARLSVRGAQCFCNTNPDNPYHWFYTDYIQNNKIKDKKVWLFTMDDNLSLDKDYVESLKQMYTGVWYERMIEGKWVAAEGRVYDMFDPEKHMRDTQRIIADWCINPNAITWLVGCDYATSSVMTWGLFAVHPDGKRFLKVKEFYYDARRTQLQHTDEEFAEMFAEWLGTIVPRVVYCDPSASSWKLTLQRHGYSVVNAENDVISGIRTVATAINLGYFIMDKSCVETCKEYQTYCWDNKAQTSGRDRVVKDHDHTCDADRYVIHTHSLKGMAGVYD